MIGSLDAGRGAGDNACDSSRTARNTSSRKKHFVLLGVCCHAARIVKLREREANTVEEPGIAHTSRRLKTGRRKGGGKK